MSAIKNTYERLVALLSSRIGEGLALLATRVALAGIFWRAGRTKVVEGTTLQIDEIQYFIFDNEFSGLPLSSDIAVPLATYAEHFFPILLVLGLATRFSALSLGIMTLAIQVFVFPEAFWQTHLLWFAMAGVLLSRGAGIFSLDALLGYLRSASLKPAAPTIAPSLASARPA